MRNIFCVQWKMEWKHRTERLMVVRKKDSSYLRIKRKYFSSFVRLLQEWPYLKHVAATRHLGGHALWGYSLKFTRVYRSVWQIACNQNLSLYRLFNLLSYGKWFDLHSPSRSLNDQVTVHIFEIWKPAFKCLHYYSHFCWKECLIRIHS